MVGPRRVQNLNLDVQDAVPVQGNNVGNEQVSKGNLQGPPGIDNFLPRLPKQPARPIKIICKFDIHCCRHLPCLNDLDLRVILCSMH